MNFLPLIEKNGNMTIINVDSIHAIYKNDGVCAISYGNNQTIFLDISVEDIAYKLDGFLYGRGVKK